MIAKRTIDKNKTTYKKQVAYTMQPKVVGDPRDKKTTGLV